MDVSKLEPAERNFKRELTTLIVILVIAFGAGTLILYNYMTMTVRQNKELAEGRSPEIGELVKNYSFRDKDNKDASFFDFTGQVTLMACFSINQLEDSKVVLETLQKFEEAYADEPRVQFLLLSLDAEGDVTTDQVREVLNSKGFTSDKWNVALSNGDLFLAYIKKQLKFIHLAKQKRDGKWIIPQRIRVLAPDLKLRGKESEYDFGKMLKDQEEAKIELVDNVKFKNDSFYQGDVSKINFVKHGQEVIKRSVDWILKNEAFDKAIIDESKKKNIYKPFLWLFGGFIVFIVILGWKVRKKAK